MKFHPRKCIVCDKWVYDGKWVAIKLGQAAKSSYYCADCFAIHAERTTYNHTVPNGVVTK